MDPKSSLRFQLNSICRLCIKLLESEKVSPIFNNDKYAKCTPLSERIHYCSSIKVAEGDGLPPYICSNCLLKLNQSFVFRNQCVLADNTLKRLIRDVNCSFDEIPKFLDADIENQIIKQEDVEHKMPISDVSEVIQKSHPEHQVSCNISIDEFDNSKNGRHKRNINETKEGYLSKPSVLEREFQTKQENDSQNAGWLAYSESEVCEGPDEFISLSPVVSSESNECQFFEEVVKKKKGKHRIPKKETSSNSDIFNSFEETSSRTTSTEKEIPNVFETHIEKENRIRVKKFTKLKEKKNDEFKTEDFDIKQEVLDIAETFTIEPDVFSFNETKKEFDIKNEDEELDENESQKPLKKSLGDKTVAGRRGRPRKYPIVKDKPSTYTCEYCQKVYPSEGGWRYHIHTMHNENYQPFICDLCGKAFKVKKNLEGHKNSIHFHLKQHLCDLCGRGFASKYALKVHKIWHNDEKNFPCDICGTKFRTRGKMNTHRSIHGGPKKFMCHVCSRDFRWKKDFEIHMRTHTGEKPFKCSHCGKAFSSLTNMKKHERNHLEKYISARGPEPHEAPITIPTSDEETFKGDVTFSHNYSIDEMKNRHIE